MKKVFKIIALGITLTFALSSCNKNDSLPFSDPVTYNAIKTGKWKVSYYTRNDEDRAFLFSGFYFELDNQTITATRQNYIVYGTWSVRLEKDIQKIKLNFKEDEEFKGLNEEWDVTELGAERIKLSRQAYFGEYKFLNFDKIQP